MADRLGNVESREKKTYVFREGGVYKNILYDGPKPRVSNAEFTVYDENSFRSESGLLNVASLEKQTAKNKEILLKESHDTFVRIRDSDYEVRDGKLYEPASGKEYKDKPVIRKPKSREQVVKKALEKTQEVVRSSKSSSAEKKAASAQAKQLHKEQDVIRKVAKAPVKKTQRTINPEGRLAKQRIKAMFPEKAVNATPESRREDIAAVKAQEYNRILKNRLGDLDPTKKKQLLSGTSQAKTLQREIQKGVLQAAVLRTDIILTEKLATPPKKASVAVKNIWGTQRAIPIGKDKTKNIRIMPENNPKARGPNKKTQKVLRKNGLDVVVSVGSARAKREAGKERRAKERAVVQRRNARAREKQAVINRKVFGTSRPRSDEHLEKNKMAQRAARAKDASLKTERTEANKRFVQLAKKIDARSRSKGNTQSIGVIAKKMGTTLAGYRRGKYFAGKADLSVPLTKSLRGDISKIPLPESSRNTRRFRPMNHGGPKPYRPRQITSKMRKQISGNLKVQRLVGFRSKMGPQLNRFNLFSTNKAMWVPGRKGFYTDPMTGKIQKAGGLMMAMQLRGLITINGREVTNRITQRMIPAVRKGIVAASERVGRKILDIIEPYVPKDRGYMYQSATVNANQASGDNGAGGIISMADGTAFPESERLGVSFSYNAPYAEMVYFDESKAHGAQYNQIHGVQEKGEKETARWIEVALQKEEVRLRSLLGDYALAVTTALNSAGGGGKMK